MKDIVLTVSGLTFAVTLAEEDGALAVEPTGEPGARMGEALTLAADICADFALYRLKTPDVPEGFVDPFDELVDWLRVNYGDTAVTYTREDEAGRVY